MTLSNSQVWSVPLDEANLDYQAIQEWIAAGNTVIDNPPE
jgi:Tfp pilus assembly PilM family ATPase